MLRFLCLAFALLGPALASASPAWEPRFVGSGEIEDIRTGGTIRLPMERRVHVALLAEGYTQADLDAGLFDREVERWMAEVFAVEPYSTFREALVIWTLAVPSNERVGPGVRDTAFRLPLEKRGRGIDMSMRGDGETAGRVWDALRTLPQAPARFWPPGGRTSRLSRNVVAHLLVRDPRKGGRGISGAALPIIDPADRRHRVALAMGHGLAHEFTHAFARLQDEYLEEAGSFGSDPVQASASSATITNVVTGASCDTLPWKHLLPGGAINPHTHGLVGAYGFADTGYHPELTCLMNGAHDNARYYGGDGWLRSPTRLCNFCREIAAMRFLERTGVLADSETSLRIWARDYRAPFFARYGFDAPENLPQRTSDGVAWNQVCAAGES